jgi:phosphate transport system permease protein
MAAAAPAAPVQSVRERVQAAGARIKRVKLLDRFATGFITFGGVFIIIAVSFIFIFIFAETLPLFRPAVGKARDVIRLPDAPALEAAAPVASVLPEDEPRRLAFGTDEYQLYFYELLSDARVVFRKVEDRSVAQQVPLPGLGGVVLSSASRSLDDDYLGAGTVDGRVSLQQVIFRPRYEEQKLVDLELVVRDRGTFELDPARRPVREVAYGEADGRKTVAAVVGEDEIKVLRTDDEGAEQRIDLRSNDGEKVTRVRLGRSDTLVASTAGGNLYHWELVPEVRLTEVKHVSTEPITALEYTLGGITLVVGDEKGNVSGWFKVREKEEDTELRFARAHVYAPQGTPVRAIAASTRDKSFVTAGADGSIVMRHMTSERTVLTLAPTGQSIDALLITPKMDGILAQQADGGIAVYDIYAPHPDVSFGALLGKVWYEGYASPQYVWQSTGGTDDFETKFSLVPLIFGTIKGTLYALLFAIPIAIMGALYTSQFMHPSVKAKIKPTVEIMAALPSVVIGFIAGLWLASRVEREIVPVLLMVVLLPLFGTLGIFVWDRVPRALRKRLRPGMEIAVILPLLLVGAFVALRMGPVVEATAFGGDFRLWLNDALGLVYDQRNCLVVGLAMGFAVIPIIFTIAEDSFTSVPQHLTAASLALGASRWQTATRVVLPTASPGIFSAVMIGFGRAVGETMIVLMATGNTPVLDWSIFNGMRTLSANIAVEIPEAPYGGTLYRTLFLAALVLFFMTFLVNTLAEVIRQRLRERYRAI